MFTNATIPKTYLCAPAGCDIKQNSTCTALPLITIIIIPPANKRAYIIPAGSISIHTTVLRLLKMDLILIKSRRNSYIGFCFLRLQPCNCTYLL